jgi:hypothetical protein
MLILSINPRKIEYSQSVTISSKNHTVDEALGAPQWKIERNEWFDLTREQVTAVLDFAARSLETPTRR